MARKKIREHATKTLLSNHVNRLSKNVDIKFKAAQIHAKTDFDALLKENPWLQTDKLVAKPDCLFGQRGKNNLLMLNKGWEEAKAFCLERIGKELEHNGVSGVLTHFIVEPFVPHKEEYYFSIQSLFTGNKLSFSACGGIDIEENWDKVKHLEIGIDQDIDTSDLSLFESEVEQSLRHKITAFLRAIYKVFCDLDFSFLEMNPFCLDGAGQPFPLDMRGELDSTAHFRNIRTWGDIEFPQPFGRSLFPEENYVNGLDEKTGASLKLTILNPAGRIWAMVAGGGASVIYADTVADLGWVKELGNYGEYSGAPNQEETYKYAKTLVELGTRNPDKQGRALIVGGGIANFTDVAATFKGIVQAFRELKEEMKAANMKVWVRRGGPNYQAGLKLMRELGKEIGVDIDVYGPEVTMTKIIPMAIDYIKESTVGA